MFRLLCTLLLTNIFFNLNNAFRIVGWFNYDSFEYNNTLINWTYAGVNSL
jgi:hypothetical protein